MIHQTRITIIIATYNAQRYLRQAIHSVRTQAYSNLELIVVDGGSTDGTLTIIKDNLDVIDTWISEPDKGIYDAWNKGVDRATGNWIMFLGSDDILLLNALQRYAHFITSLSREVDYISSKARMVDKYMKPVREIGWHWEWPGFLRGMTVAHPGSLHAKALFKTYGSYNDAYKIVGDYELLLRPGAKLKTAFMDAVTVCMREGGVSDSWAAIREQCLASIKTGRALPLPAKTNMLFLGSKFYVKRLLRSIGINAYLRR